MSIVVELTLLNNEPERQAALYAVMPARVSVLTLADPRPAGSRFLALHFRPHLTPTSGSLAPVTHRR